MNTRRLCQSAMKFATRFFFTLTLFRVAYCQVITLSDYSATSGLSNGLVREGERVIFHSLVDISRSPDTEAVVNYEIKRTHQVRFEHLCYLVIPDECRRQSSSTCSCQSLASGGMFHVSINMTAYKVNSQANLRGELVHRHTAFYSEVRTLPTIHDLGSDLLTVYINDRLMDLANCSTSTHESSIIVVAQCSDGCPCSFESLDENFNQTVKRGFNVISYLPNFEQVELMNMRLKFEVCQTVKNVSCVIRKELVNTSDRIKEKDLPHMIVIVLLISLTIVTVFMTIKRKRIITSLQSIRPLVKNNPSQCNSEEMKNLEEYKGKQRNICNGYQMKNLGESNTKQQKSKEELDFKKVIHIHLEDNVSETSTLISEISDQNQVSTRKFPKSNTVCDIQVNPLYKDIMPLTMFDISDLPVLYREDILFQYILTVASLTVKCTFSKSSGDNIKSFQFLSHRKGGSRTAAQKDVTEIDGMITDIEIFENGYNMFRRKHKDYSNCPCDYCKTSTQPIHEWVEITISFSSAHVVRFLLEKDIKFTIFSEHFNLKEIKGTYEINASKQSDICQLKIVTCDKAVLEQKSEIKRLLDKLIDLNTEANDYFHTFKDLDRIYISISYLHNSTRYVSIGEWKEIYQDYRKRSVITYTSNLHPQSDGGPVILIGYSDTSLFYYMKRSATGISPKFSSSNIVLKI